MGKKGKVKKVNFASKKFYSLLFSATLAIAIEYLVLLSDNIIVGNMLGETGIAGMNVITPFLSLSAFVSILLSSGTTILISRAMGEFDKDKANRYFGMGLIGSAASGIITFLVILIGGYIYIHYMNLSPQVYAYAMGYYKGIVLLGLIQPFYSTLYELIYNDGGNGLCSISAVAQVVTNVGLSILLCKFIGILGVSIATVISLILASIVLIIHFKLDKTSMKFVWYFNIKELWNVCKLSLTDASLYLYFSLFLLVMNKFIVACFGEAVLPVFTIAFNLTEATIIFDGIGEAMQPLISVYFTENNTKGIKATMKSAAITAAIEGFSALICFQIFAGVIPKLFGITDSTLVEQSTLAIRIVSLMFPLYSFIYLFSSYYLDIDKTRLAILISTMSNLVMNTLCAVSLGYIFGLEEVWVGIGVSTLLSILICSTIIILKYGKKEFPLLLDPSRDAKIYYYCVEISENNIMELVTKAEKLLKENDVEPKIKNRVMLIIEELGMIILEKNKDKKVILELTLDLNDGIGLVLRDDGVMFDITDTDMQVVSLRYFVASCVLSKQEYRRHLITTGYNRNGFKFT